MIDEIINERKRYMLFSYEQYFPQGPKYDFAGMYNTIEEAKAEAKKRNDDYADVLDLDTGEWIDID